MHRCWQLLIAAAATITTATGARAQLPLRDALRLADRAAFPNRIAAGNTAAHRGEALAPLRGLLPSLHLDAGYVRTTDPISTFGLTLQQRRITAADFEPQRLNFPDAVGNYNAGIVVEQPVFNAEAWTGRRAARSALDAAAAEQDWTRLSTHADVIRAYYGAVLAAERTAELGSAARAAHAHVAQAQSMVRNGLVTKSDALLADVRAGDVDARLADACGAAESARRQVEVALGEDPTGRLVLPYALPATARITELVAPDTAAQPPADRADVDAARRGLDAARADALRARSTYLPRINGFARYDWNSAARPYAGDKNWTVGLMASWSVFAGGATLSDIQATGGRESAARAQAEAASARARLEAEQSRSALKVALTRLQIAERAVTQSAEAHRIVSRQYEGGLVTIAELLDAQAADIESSLGLSQARYAVIVAAAERRLALGLDPGSLAALDDASSATNSSDAAARSPSDPAPCTP